MPDVPNDNSDYLKKLKELVAKAGAGAIGIDAETGKPSDAPLEGYGALKAGLPADPGRAGGVQPEGSPIDFLAGPGAKLGRAMARDAGGIVGNEIGSIGANIKSPAASGTWPQNVLSHPSPGLAAKARASLPTLSKDIAKPIISESAAPAQMAIQRSGATAAPAAAPIMQAAPTKMGPAAAQEAQAIAKSNMVAELAEQQAGKPGALTMQDMIRAQQQQSRAVDMADRARKQAEGPSALARLNALRKMSGQ